MEQVTATHVGLEEYRHEVGACWRGWWKHPIPERRGRSCGDPRCVKDWENEAFTDPTTRRPYAVPEALKSAALRLCGAYGIRGIADPMYIANVIAVELGLGDGASNFTEGGQA